MKGSTVLIVEDDLIVANDLRQQLRRLGYGVPEMAATAADAIRLACTLRPDLVVMDIRLGSGMCDGIEATRHICEVLDVPVVYLTAYADDETLARATSTEHYGYLVKPFDATGLCAAIESAL